MKRFNNLSFSQLNNIKILFIKEKFKTERGMAVVFVSIKQEGSLKDNGNLIIEMVMEWNDTQTGTNMKVTLKIINLMAKGSIRGLTEKYMKENGNKV